MELVKKNIHMDRVKSSASTQITLEDDVNISDARPDASKLIYDRGTVTLDEIKVTEDHVSVKGRLEFVIMYLTEGDNPYPACMEGSIAFEEQVYMEGIQSGDAVNVVWELEDLSTGLINSRKLSIQALVLLKLCAEEIYDEETAVDLYHEEPVEYRKKPLQIVQMAVKKRDIFRIKEDFEILQNSPNINRLIWSTIKLGDVECKAQEEKISVQGEVCAFFLYESAGEDRPIRTLETVVSFGGMIDCHGCNEAMIADITCAVGHQEIEVRADFDGEDRIFAVELALDLDISLYEEERLDILSGVYGVVKEVEAVSRPAVFKSLLAKNSGKTKIGERIKLQGSDGHMMQLLHCQGEVLAESPEIKENGVYIRGMLYLQALYLSSDSRAPYGSIKGAIPFSYFLEIPEATGDCTCKANVGLEQLNAVMIDSDEIDIKAVLSMRTIVFEEKTEEIVTQINVSDLDMNKLSELPGIVIYIAKEGDSLWDVGKRYYVPISQIKETNDMTSEDIRPGDKLLIVKGVSA